MKQKTWHWIHRWLSFLIGIFFIFWTVSGIAMVLPGRWFEPAQIYRPQAPDYKTALISPAEVVAIVEEMEGEPVRVLKIGPVIIQGKYIHEVVLDTGESRLIDANTGEAVWITEEIAAQIAQDYAQPGLKLKEIELLDSHDASYPFGPLPVYRIIFEGDRSNIYYISLQTGAVSRSTNLTRIRAAISSLHTFEPIKLIPNTDRLQKGLLLLTSFVGLTTTIIGYWIFFLPYLRRRNQRKKQQPSPAE